MQGPITEQPIPPVPPTEPVAQKLTPPVIELNEKYLPFIKPRPTIELGERGQLGKKSTLPPELTVEQAKISQLVDEYDIEPTEAQAILEGRKPLAGLIPINERWNTMSREEQIASFVRRYGMDVDEATSYIDEPSILHLGGPAYARFK